VALPSGDDRTGSGEVFDELDAFTHNPITAATIVAAAPIRAMTTPSDIRNCSVSPNLFFGRARRARIPSFHPSLGSLSSEIPRCRFFAKTRSGMARRARGRCVRILSKVAFLS